MLRSPGCVLDGLALQYAVLPSLALLLVQLLGLPPEYAVGEGAAAQGPALLETWPAVAVVVLQALLFGRLTPVPARCSAGLLLVSCCPGGSASAMVSHLAGADVPLNVTMTAGVKQQRGVLGSWPPTICLLLRFALVLSRLHSLHRADPVAVPMNPRNLYPMQPARWRPP